MIGARWRLLEAADRCFERQGIAATGINELITEAGVARMSLYNHFASKDDLVSAWLEGRDRAWADRIRQRLAAVADPEERVLTVVREYARRFRLEGFRGCEFVNAAAELPEDHPAREVISRHKAGVRALLGGLLAETGVLDPDGAAEAIYLLCEGAIVTSGIDRDDRAFAAAEASARRILGSTG